MRDIDELVDMLREYAEEYEDTMAGQLMYEAAVAIEAYRRATDEC